MSPAWALRFTLRLLLRTKCSATPWLAARSAILVSVPSSPCATCPSFLQLPPKPKQVAAPHIQLQLTPTSLKPLTQTPNAPTCPYLQPTKQFVDPKDIAALVLHLCGPNSKSFTGACLSIDGKPQAFTPVTCLYQVAMTNAARNVATCELQCAHTFNSLAAYQGGVAGVSCIALEILTAWRSQAVVCLL